MVPFQPGALDMPEPAAIIRRWHELCATIGLEVRFDKCHIACASGKVIAAEYGHDHQNPDAAGDKIGVDVGLGIMGVPCGSEEYERAVATAKARAATSKLDAGLDRLTEDIELSDGAKQAQLLISRGCGGVGLINDLLRNLGPSVVGEACIETDAATRGRLEALVGAPLNDTQLARAFLPLRQGGVGYRLAEVVAPAALVGGWAACLQGFTIVDMCPELEDVVKRPHAYAHLPHVAAVQDAWASCTASSPHVALLASAPRL